MHPSPSCSLSTATHRLVCVASRRWLAVAAAAVVAAMPLGVALADSPHKQGGIIIHEDRDAGVIIQDRANSEFDNVEFIGTLTV